MLHLGANCATPWPIVKRFTNNDLMGLGAKVPRGKHRARDGSGITL
jgi:hypothetical protein